MKLEELKNHPAAGAYRMMTDAERAELVKDIRSNGLRHPIILAKYDGEWAVLDGRNRKRACEEIGIRPRVDYFEGDFEDAKAYVRSINGNRRHLTDTERALAVTFLATLKPGRPSENTPIGAITLAAAAEDAGVSKRGVERAKVVVDHGTPELIEAVQRGDVALSRGEEIARLAKEQQADALEQARNTKREPKRPSEDPKQSRAERLVDADIERLRALCDVAREHRNHLVREAVDVLVRVFPALKEQA